MWMFSNIWGFPLLVLQLTVFQGSFGSSYMLGEHPEMKPEDKFNFRYRYKGVFTEEDHVTWRIEKLQKIHIRRYSHIYVNDSSIVQIGIRFDHLQNIKVAVYNETHQRLNWKFFFAPEHMVLITDQRIRDQIWIEVNGTQEYDPQSSYQVSYAYNEMSKKKEYFAYLSMYPYRASEGFPGVQHNRMTSLTLNLIFKNKNYHIFMPNRVNNGTAVNVAMDGMGFVMMRNYVEYKITKTVRLIVHTLSRKTVAPMQVYPFINATRLVLQHMHEQFNSTIRELITLIILPTVNARPMAFLKDICIMDAGIAEAPLENILMNVMKCFMQQNIIRSLGTRDELTQRLMQGIRDYFAIQYMDRTWWSYDARDYVSEKGKLLDDEQILAVKHRWVNANKEEVKIVAFMDIIREQFQKKVKKFHQLLWSFFHLNLPETPSQPCYNASDVYNYTIECAKTMEFVDIVERFRYSEKDFNYSKEVAMDKFIGGWLKEGGYPIIKARVSNNSRTGTVDMNIAGITTTEETKLYFPIFLTIKSRVNKSVIDDLEVYYIIKKETHNDTFWYETNSFETIRNYPQMVTENRTLYYYLTINGTGMYRVFYRDENWKWLLKYYFELPETVRAKYITDVHYFHKRGDLTWRLVFRLIHRLRFEKSPRVWLAAEMLVIDLEKRFRFSPFEHDFWRLMIVVLQRFYDSTERRNPLALKLACLVQMEICHQEASNLTKEVIADNANFYRFEDVLCAGMRKMSEEEYLYFVNLVKGFDYKHRYHLLIALGCKQNYWRLYGLLHSTFVTETIVAPIQVKWMLLTNMFLAGPDGTAAVIDFMKSYHWTLNKMISRDDLENLIMMMCGYLKRREEYRGMRELMLLLGIDTYDCLTMIHDQMSWMKRNFKLMKGYLRTTRRLDRIMY